MQKKSMMWVVIVAIVVLAGGGYLLLHKGKSNSGYGSTNTGSSNSNQSSNAAVNNDLLKTKSDASLGQYLTDPSGKPLYTYNGDTSGVSNCTSSCLDSWPAYQATSSQASLPTNISTIKRSDNGQTQYAYKGMPLYYFTSDTGSQPTGNGVGNFSLARP